MRPVWQPASRLGPRLADPGETLKVLGDPARRPMPGREERCKTSGVGGFPLLTRRDLARDGRRRHLFPRRPGRSTSRAAGFSIEVDRRVT
jgi:hypothetical protein